MPKMVPPDIGGIPWPFEVLIEDLSDYFLLLKEIGHSHSPEYEADIECQVISLSQEEIQSSPEDSAFDWKYPHHKFRDLIEHPSTATLSENPWPWMATRETPQWELSYFDSSEEYPLEDSIINGLLKMLDSDVEADTNLTISPSTNYGTLISDVNDFSASSYWTKSASPISAYSDIILDYTGSDTEEYRNLDHIFSPRPYTMPFPVVTMKTLPEEEFLCESLVSNHLLFPSSVDESGSCYGMLLSPILSGIDSLPYGNSWRAPPITPAILTPKPKYPLPTWFY